MPVTLTGIEVQHDSRYLFQVKKICVNFEVECTDSGRPALNCDDLREVYWKCDLHSVTTAS